MSDKLEKVAKIILNSYHTILSIEINLHCKVILRLSDRLGLATKNIDIFIEIFISSQAIDNN